MIQDDRSINSIRQHIISGLLKALKNKDTIDAILNKRDSAEKILTEKYGFTPIERKLMLLS